MQPHEHVPNLPEADQDKCEAMESTELVDPAKATSLNGWYVIQNVQSKKYLMFKGKWIEARGTRVEDALRFQISANRGKPVIIGGEFDYKWMNYRNTTGCVKKYDDPTNWSFLELANGTWQIFSEQVGQFTGLWDDNDVGVYVRGSMDKPKKKNHWILRKV